MRPSTSSIGLRTACNAPKDKINHALVSVVLKALARTPYSRRSREQSVRGTLSRLAAAHLGRFNGFSKSVILRINEAHDLGGEVSKYAFYER